MITALFGYYAVFGRLILTGALILKVNLQA